MLSVYLLILSKLASVKWRVLLWPELDPTLFAEAILIVYPRVKVTGIVGVRVIHRLKQIEPLMIYVSFLFCDFIELFYD